MALHDRIVRETGSEKVVGGGENPFSAYVYLPNIVLLGDPGAGKSHLFREFANAAGVELKTARSFLNSDPALMKGSEAIFIDALDEHRTGRGDHNVIDAIVQKLVSVKPRAVRIACRAADWLGETDLAAFRTYFASTEEPVVLHLQTLSRTEQNEMLAELGVSDPALFLNEASHRGLDDLLGNPQNLTMLAKVVKTGNWPSGRAELFQQALKILLQEHSKSQTYRPTGKYSPTELMSVAGELCAVRLIGDIASISLTENDCDHDLPSYRSICSSNPDKALAALGRRLFVSGPERETVDYAHRTIAEYLGGQWLAGQVRNGLPLGRVRALLGVDGRPASELRGLHAWLAVHLPEHAVELIDSDAFGVLSYADAAALSPHLRQHLLDALATLAQADPWFRRWHESSAAIGGLSGPDMVEAFKSILGSREETLLSLRMLLLDSLQYAELGSKLTDLLQALVLTPAVTFAERYACVEALLSGASVGTASLRFLYDKLGADNADDLRLRTRFMAKLFGTGLGTSEMAELFVDGLKLKEKLPVGQFWRIGECIGDNEVGELLDTLVRSIPEDLANENSLESPEVMREVDRLIIRGVSLKPSAKGERLLAWLEFRRRCAVRTSSDSMDRLRDVLIADAPALVQLVDTLIQRLVVDDRQWGDVHRMRETLVFALDDTLFLERAMVALEQESLPTKKGFLYELSLRLTFLIGEGALNPFDALLSLADGKPDLELVRESCCAVDIPEWRIENSERRDVAEAHQASVREQNRARFAENREAIRSGSHLRWLTWIAQIYFGNFSDSDQQLSPRGRLIKELGSDDADTALQGLVAYVRLGTTSDVNDVVQTHLQGRHFSWCYVVLAGLDEYCSIDRDVQTLPDLFLETALIIDSLYPTFQTSGNVSNQQIHAWKTTLLRTRPELAFQAYSRIARASLASGAENVDGLYSLLRTAELEPFREVIAFELLKENPHAPSQALRELLPVAMASDDIGRFTTLATCAVANGHRNGDCYSLWLAAAFLVCPEDFAGRFRAAKGDVASSLIWALRDLSGFTRRMRGDQNVLTPAQLEEMLRLVFERYKRTTNPPGGWSGDTNDWDATDYALKMITELSSRSEIAAGEVLERLLSAAGAESYATDIKHGIAQQHIRAIDSNYKQPTWAAAIATLANAKPANIADLHALILAHLNDFATRVGTANVDMYKRFWNEDQYGRVDTPKTEESCRDYLVERLSDSTRVQQIAVEPEGHMAKDKRADVVAILPGMKVVIELKRDIHDEVWTAIETQLERFYTRDPEAQGFGIYGVFWFGEKRRGKISVPPKPLTMPRTAREMQQQLSSLIPAARRGKIAVIVIDVSGEIPE